nr:uncharacterized protein LOC127313899 [Lolium perenne]
MEVGDVLDEMKRQLKLGLPISFTYVLNLSLVFVALMFVGHLSDSQHVFAGTALATSFSFVTGFSMMRRRGFRQCRQENRTRGAVFRRECGGAPEGGFHEAAGSTGAGEPAAEVRRIPLALGLLVEEERLRSNC